jgi:hypothetical protein
MFAVGLVHGTAASVATRAKWRLKSKRRSVVWFIETHSATTVQRLYRNTHQKFPPTRKSIYARRKRFEETGCLCKGKSPGKPRVADDTTEAVRRSYMRSPSRSTNCASRELDTPQPTVRKILRKRKRWGLTKSRCSKLHSVNWPEHNEQNVGWTSVHLGRNPCYKWCSHWTFIKWKKDFVRFFIQW